MASDPTRAVVEAARDFVNLPETYQIQRALQECNLRTALRALDAAGAPAVDGPEALLRAVMAETGLPASALALIERGYAGGGREWAVRTVNSCEDQPEIDRLRAELYELHEMLRAAGWDRDGERTAGTETAGQFLHKLLVSGRDTWAEAHRLRADLARVEEERDAARRFWHSWHRKAERYKTLIQHQKSAIERSKSALTAERARVERVRAVVAGWRKGPMRGQTYAAEVQRALDGEP